MASTGTLKARPKKSTFEKSIPKAVADRFELEMLDIGPDDVLDDKLPPLLDIDGKPVPVWPMPDARFRRLHELLAADQIQEAVEMMLTGSTAFVAALQASGISQAETVGDLLQIAWLFVDWLLQQGMYAEAACVIWPQTIFDFRPRQVRMIWHAITTGSRVGIMGGGSMSKTYTAAAWFFLDWLADREYTVVKVMSSTGIHAASNIFTDITRFHNDSVIPLPGDVMAMSISMDKKRGFGLSVLSIPQGSRSWGRLKGFKKKPRKIPHPRFGKGGRLRIIVDEAEQTAPGFWGELHNLFTSDSSDGNIKVVCAWNPGDASSLCGANAHPVGGYGKITTSVDAWQSATQWSIFRLNSMKSENVVTGKNLFAGVATRAGVAQVIAQCGGNDMSPSVWTQVYGMYPPEGSVQVIIPRNRIDACRGEWIFTGRTFNFGGLDIALNGGDRPMLAYGRHGYASGWRDEAGVIHHLRDMRDDLGAEAPDRKAQILPAPTQMLGGRRVCQLDGIIELNRGDTLDVVEQAQQHIKELNLKALAADMTGAGAGVSNILARIEERCDIVQVQYSSSATDKMILAEDTVLPKDLYERVFAELWYAVAFWMEADVIRIGNAIPEDILAELSNRRSLRGKQKKISIESKDDYKARGFRSPDGADAITLWVHAIRDKSNWVPGLIEDTDEDQMEIDGHPLPVGPVTKLASPVRLEKFASSNNPDESMPEMKKIDQAAKQQEKQRFGHITSILNGDNDKPKAKKLFIC